MCQWYMVTDKRYFRMFCLVGDYHQYPWEEDLNMGY